MEGVVLKREGRVQINANVDEQIYSLMSTYIGGLSQFFKDAIDAGLKDQAAIKEVGSQMLVYEDRRRAARKRGYEVRTVSCKIEKSVYQNLKALEADSRLVEGFKLSKYITTCVWVYASKMVSKYGG